MLLFTFTALAGIVSLVNAYPPLEYRDDAPERCGTKASESFLQKSVLLEEAEEAARSAGNITNRDKINVKTYLHLIVSSDPSKNANTSIEQLTSQMDVLNDDFSDANIHFDLVSIDTVVDDTWAKGGREMDMKRTLRRGDYASLNLYYMNKINDHLGVCTLPQYATQGTEEFYDDGCRLQASTLPGGSELHYNKGRTTTHEVGHWLGLLHTFEGRTCGGVGDAIADTPQQSSPSFGCPKQDSCTDMPGLDPSNNFMDYSYDSCMTEFTPGQITRMRNWWSKYRG